MPASGRRGRRRPGLSTPRHAEARPLAGAARSGRRTATPCVLLRKSAILQAAVWALLSRSARGSHRMGRVRRLRPAWPVRSGASTCIPAQGAGETARCRERGSAGPRRPLGCRSRIAMGERRLARRVTGRGAWLASCDEVTVGRAGCSHRTPGVTTRPDLQFWLSLQVWRVRVRGGWPEAIPLSSRSCWVWWRLWSLLRAWCSIWRIRSRVTLNARPTSSSVRGCWSPRP